MSFEAKDSFKEMLAQLNFYGPEILKDVRMAVSFWGTPSTEKKHELTGVAEDVVFDGAWIPTQQDQNRASATGDMFCQKVSLFHVNIQATKDWMNLGGQGFTETNAGMLTLGVYSMLTGNDFQQIAMFECDTACAMEYNTKGQLDFLCTGAISWSARCKTLTGTTSKQDWAGAWNNTTVGEGGGGGE
jgi:hypothetical protein